MSDNISIDVEIDPIYVCEGWVCYLQHPLGWIRASVYIATVLLLVGLWVAVHRYKHDEQLMWQMVGSGVTALVAMYAAWWLTTMGVSLITIGIGGGVLGWLVGLGVYRVGIEYIG